MNKILKRIINFFKTNKKSLYDTSLYGTLVAQPKFPKPPRPNNEVCEKKKN